MAELREDTLIYPVLVELAACLCTELADAGFNTCFCGLVPGEEAVLDFCEGDTCGGDGDCGGMGWVRLSNVTPIEGDLTPASSANCNTRLGFEIEVGSAFCAPLPDASGNPPSLEDQLEAVRKQTAAMAAIHRAISCCFREKYEDVDYVLGTYQPLPILGGCMGGTWTVVVEQV